MREGVKEVVMGSFAKVGGVGGGEGKEVCVEGVSGSEVPGEVCGTEEALTESELQVRRRSTRSSLSQDVSGGGRVCVSGSSSHYTASKCFLRSIYFQYFFVRMLSVF